MSKEIELQTPKHAIPLLPTARTGENKPRPTATPQPLSTPSEIIVCRICGREIVRSSRLGRTPEYHPICRKINRLLIWIEGAIDDPSFAMTRPAAKAFRARLWALANYLNDRQDEDEPRELK